MKRQLLFIAALCSDTSSLLPMDVDKPISNSLPDEYCLFIKVRDSSTPIGIPKRFAKIFEEKIEIAKTLNPETMIYQNPFILAADIAKLLPLLEVFLKNDNARLTNLIAAIPTDTIIRLANAAISLNLYGLRALFSDRLTDIIDQQTKTLNTDQKIAFIKQFESLEPFYINIIKRDLSLLFKTGIVTLRDEDPSRMQQPKILSTIPLAEESVVKLSPDGSHVVWIDENKMLQALDLITNKKETLNLTELNIALSPETDVALSNNASQIAIFDGNKALIWYRKLNNTKSIEVTFKIEQIAFNNNNFSYIFAGTEPSMVIVGKANSVIPLQKPDETYTMLSSCFSHNGEYAYILYKTPADIYNITVYRAHDGSRIYSKEVKKLYGICPGKESDTIWALGTGALWKLVFEDLENRIMIRVKDLKKILIENDGTNIISWQIDPTENWALLQNDRDAVELINIQMGHTECIYRGIQQIAFNPNTGGLVYIDNEENEDGTHDINTISFAPIHITSGLEELYKTLSLTQLITLAELVTITDKKELIKKMNTFLPTVPPHIQYIIQQHFPIYTMHQRPEPPLNEPPAKKPKI